MVPAAFLQGRLCLELREEIPKQHAVRLWRVLDAVPGFGALRVGPQIEVFKGTLVPPPESDPRAQTCGRLDVEFESATAKNKIVENCFGSILQFH